MDNGSDDSGEKECKSADPRRLVAPNGRGGGDGGSGSGEELEENRNNGDRLEQNNQADSWGKRRHIQDDRGGAVSGQGVVSGGDQEHNRRQRRNTPAPSSIPWLPLFADQLQQHVRLGIAAHNSSPEELRQCSSTLTGIHTFYSTAQKHFMVQMQELMGAAVAHHAMSVAAANAAGAFPGGSLPSASSVSRTDVNAISRACATALAIINSLDGGAGANAPPPPQQQQQPAQTSAGAAFPLMPTSVATAAGPSRDTTKLPQTAQPFPTMISPAVTSALGNLMLPLPVLPMNLTLPVPLHGMSNAPASVMEALLRGPGSSGEAARAASHLPLPQMVPVSGGGPSAPTQLASFPVVNPVAMNAQVAGLPLAMQLHWAAAAAASRGMPQVQHLQQQQAQEQQQPVVILASKPAQN